MQAAKVEDSPVAQPAAFCFPQSPDDSVGGEEGCQLNRNGKLKQSCEKCSTAKVKCSGAIPCDRCTRKGFECEYKIEKKRGRRTTQKQKETVCSDASCWGQVVMNPINKCEDFGAKFGLESIERRLFQTFFAIYKHHATPNSCCREWFTYQLNKMSTFLLKNGNKEGSVRLDAWMEKKGVTVMRREPADYLKVPANVYDDVTGQRLPPILPMKGPKLYIDELPESAKRKRSKCGEVFSTKGLFCENVPDTPVSREIEAMRESMAFVNLRATHERFEVEVNEEFTALFGYTTRSLVNLLERLFGGLLPWGCDLLALLLAKDQDLLFFMRMLAMKFNSVGRPASFPATRQIMTSHILEFETQAGDVVECLLKAVHREYLSTERTEVDVYFGLEPIMPNVPRRFRQLDDSAKRRMKSSGLEPSMMADAHAEALGGMSLTSSESKDALLGQASITPPPPPPPPQPGAQQSLHQLPPRREIISTQADYPERGLEGMDFLDSMMDWVESTTEPGPNEDSRMMAPGTSQQFGAGAGPGVGNYGYCQEPGSRCCEPKPAVSKVEPSLGAPEGLEAGSGQGAFGPDDNDDLLALLPPAP